MSADETSPTRPQKEANHLRFWLRAFAVVIIASGLLSAFVGLAKRALQAPSTWKEVLGPPPSYLVDTTKPLRDQTVPVVLGSRSFEIPLMYIDSGQPDKEGVYRDGILLEVIWPEMGTIYELKSRVEYDRIKKHERRVGWILLDVAAARPSLDEQTANRRQGLTKEEYAGPEAGLEKYLWYHGRPERPEIWAELYLEKDNAGHIITRIECRLGRGVRFPSCSHKFVHHGLIYQISYNKASFFSQWREQRERAIEFLHSFETTSSNQQHRG